jgi:hypothetical protein
VHVKYLRIAAVAATFACTRAGAQADAPSVSGLEPSGAASVRLPLDRRRPGLRPSARRTRATAAPTYTIVSVGAPSANSEPAAFNNTGQIAGYGDTGCYVYDSGTFRRLPIPSASTQFINCHLGAINDKTAAGTYQIGGTTATPYSSNVAFAVTPSSTIVYYAWSDSALLGVNNNGISLAVADFFPVRTTDLSGSQFFTAHDGGGYLTQVQAPASSATPIHYLLPLKFDQNTTTPFGSNLLNDRNEVLGYDYFTLTPTSANIAVYTLGSPASIVDSSFVPNAAYDSVYGFVPIAFNDRDQILYDADNPDVYPEGIPAVYDIGSEKKTVIPLATPTCPTGAHGVPISMNNTGEVLGEYYCQKGYGYFTWDALSGTHDLSLAIPDTNFTLYPVGVNDNGQILIELEGTWSAGAP